METVTEFSTPEEAALDLELPLLGALASPTEAPGAVAATFPQGEEALQAYNRVADRVLASPLSRLGSIGLIGDVESSVRAQTAAWVAASVASLRTSILIDADLRAAHLSFDDRGRAQEGLVDVLRYGVRSPRVVSPTQAAGLNLLPVGSGTVDFAGTYGSDAVPSLFDELRRTGDLIVINGPDLGDFQSAAPFLAQVSAWILVHRIGESDPAKTRTLRATFGREKCLGLLSLAAAVPEVARPKAHTISVGGGTVTADVVISVESGAGLLQDREPTEREAPETDTQRPDAPESVAPDARVEPAAKVGVSLDVGPELVLEDSETGVERTELASPSSESAPPAVESKAPALELDPQVVDPEAPALELDPPIVDSKAPAAEPPTPAAEITPPKRKPQPTDHGNLITSDGRADAGSGDSSASGSRVPAPPTAEEIAAWTEDSRHEESPGSDPASGEEAVVTPPVSAAVGSAPDMIDEIPPVIEERRISPIFGIAVVAVLAVVGLFLLRGGEEDAAVVVAGDAGTSGPVETTGDTGTTAAAPTGNASGLGATAIVTDDGGDVTAVEADPIAANTDAANVANAAAADDAADASVLNGRPGEDTLPLVAQGTTTDAPAQTQVADESTPPDEAPIPRAAPVGTTGRLFFVHVSSLSTEASARTEGARMQRAGFPFALRPVELPDRGTWWRVYLGPYGERDRAAAVAERAKGDGLTDYTQIHRLLTSDVEVRTGQEDQ